MFIMYIMYIMYILCLLNTIGYFFSFENGDSVIYQPWVTDILVCINLPTDKSKTKIFVLDESRVFRCYHLDIHFINYQFPVSDFLKHTCTTVDHIREIKFIDFRYYYNIMGVNCRL